jgi:prepilin-type N-terminal cleavage/methylation domain-containing protein
MTAQRLHLRESGGLARECRRCRGFSLIEAVAAIVIMAVAVPALLWAVRDVQAGRVEPVMFDRARWLATEKMEDIVADRHSSTRGYVHLLDVNYPAEPVIDGFPGFARNVVITQTDESLSAPGSGYKTIRVTVAWAGTAGAQRSFSLTSVVAELAP